MSDGREPTDVEQLVGRAQRLAIGLADTGLTQAEEMLRRVSPEGRAQARREREARRRRQQREMGQFVLVLLPAILLVYLLAMAGLDGPVPALVVLVSALMLAIHLSRRRRSTVGASPTALPAVELQRLPAEATAWLDTQRRALPAPALPLADALGHRLAELEPQLARLAPEEPAADAIRKLVATELPALVEGWRGVPPSLRSRPQADGRTPDAQLADGLRLIDGEVARMTEQLARGALDEVATQGRYLELKYRQ